MIEKIIKLRGIGLLHEPLPQGAIELNKLTAIYADNGRGKSTFACICRSLAENDPKLLLARKTIRGEHEPVVELRVSGQNYRFKNGNWDCANPAILVFDSEFVDRNVCSGNRLEPAHRENLLEFALGERGVTLKNEVDKITEEIESLNRQLREKSGEISGYAKPVYSVEQFVSLLPDPELDRKILETEKKLADAQNADLIQRRPEFKAIRLPEIQISEIEQLLQESIEAIAEEAERKVQEHIQRYLDRHGEQWIRQGLSYIKDDTCPFCGQNLSSAEIVKAYQHYFDASYEGLKHRIGETKRQITDALRDSKLDEVQKLIADNDVTQIVWSDRTDVTFPPRPNREKVVIAWRELRQSLENVLELKATSPLTRLDLPGQVRNAVRQYCEVVSQGNSYNEAVNQVNEVLRGIKSTVRSTNIAEISQMLTSLEAQKKRWEDDVKKLCEEYKTLAAKKEQLERTKAAKREELNRETTELLDKYEGAINAILQRFNAGFSIAKVTTEHARGTPRATYCLRVMDERIPVSQRSGATAGPSFSNILSDGDKRTLALAFFLARTQIEPDLANKVIIVDDPVSSFDLHRRRATIEALLALVSGCSQLVVLSHDAYFIRDVERRASDEALVLWIKRSGAYSVIETCNIDTVCRSEYYKNYQILTEYLERGPTGDPREVAKAIRPYLEHILRQRFPAELLNKKNLGLMIAAIRGSQDESPLAALKPLLRELTELNDFASPFKHAENPEDPLTLLTDAELKPMVELALKIGRGG